NGRLTAAQDSALISRREEAIAPGGRAAFDPTGRIGHDNKSGHVLVFGPQAISRPGAEAWFAHENRARIHQINRFGMRYAVAVTAAQQTDVIRAPGEVRQEG